MGCEESKVSQKPRESRTFVTLQGAFASPSLKGNAGYVLSPIDQIDYLFKDQFSNEAEYGAWQDRKIILDPNTLIVQSDSLESKKWVETLRKHFYTLAMRYPQKIRKGIQSDDNKLILDKWEVSDVTKQFNEAEKQIKNRDESHKINKGKPLPDGNYNTWIQYPKLCLREILRNEFLFDLLKQAAISAELNSQEFKKDSIDINIGSLSCAVSKVVSQGSLKGSNYFLEANTLFIVCKTQQKNLIDLIEMSNKFSQIKDNSDISQVKKTIVNFPGLTRAFKDRDCALQYQKTKLKTDSDKKLYNVLIELTIHQNSGAFDIGKLKEEDDELKNLQNLGDGLLQRLLVQITKYVPETKDQSVKKSIEQIKEGKLTKQIHTLQMKQLCYDNDPNIADKNLSNYDLDDNWNAIISSQ